MEAARGCFHVCSITSGLEHPWCFPSTVAGWLLGCKVSLMKDIFKNSKKMK